eukprot:4607886-Amphidinium_carterae.1
MMPSQNVPLRKATGSGRRCVAEDQGSQLGALPLPLAVLIPSQLADVQVDIDLSTANACAPAACMPNTACCIRTTPVHHPLPPQLLHRQCHLLLDIA